MPRPLTVGVEAALEADRLAIAFLWDLYLKETTLRVWNQPGDLTFDGSAYVGIGDRIRPQGEFRLGGGLTPKSLSFLIDGSRQDEPGSFARTLVTNTWHQRRIRMRMVCFTPGTDFRVEIGSILEWHGRMDTMPDTEGRDQPNTLQLNCEGGTFAVLSRTMATYSDTDQKKRAPLDRFFEQTASKPTQDIPFGISYTNVPGYNPGRGALGGGAGGYFGNTRGYRFL